MIDHSKERTDLQKLFYYLSKNRIKTQRNVICFFPIFLDWNGHLIMKECLQKADQALPRWIPQVLMGVLKTPVLV